MMTTWLDVAATGDFEPGNARTLPVQGGEEIAIFHTMQRVLCAGQQMPAQARPAFAGIVHGTVVTCPLHSWNISLKTGEAQGDDKGCVPTIPLKIDAGRIC
jgi:nitrite reductase (NADH) small subunit